MSLSTLRFGARVLSDTVNDGHITDGEVDLWTNQGIAEFQVFTTEAFGELYNASSTTFATVAGTANYSLSTLTGGNFYKLLGVDRTYNGVTVPMRRYTWDQRNDDNASTIEKYAPVGGNLRFQPAPTGIETRTLWYEPQPTSLANANDTWDSKLPRGDEFVEVCTAINIVTKQERDPSALLAKKASVMAEIRAMAKNRDAGEPMRVQEKRADARSWVVGRPWWDWS